MKIARTLFVSRGRTAVVILTLFLLSSRTGRTEEVSLLLDSECRRSAFAAADLEAALSDRGHKLLRASLAELPQSARGSRIVMVLLPNEQATEQMQAAGAKVVEPLKSEGFALRVTQSDERKTYWVVAGDSAGLMYGGLELAELVRVRGLQAIADDDQQPYMAMRGTKFNIPLDARTPSYTDVSDAAQKNIGEMWNMDFWQSYIDHLARHRYNFVSLWSLHPFPSLVKVPEYPQRRVGRCQAINRRVEGDVLAER